MTYQEVSAPIQAKSRKGSQLVNVLKVQTQALLAAHEFLNKKGIIQLMPVMLSPVTDPLNHSVHDASIDYLGQKLQLTKSMILHKQIAIAELDAKGIYIVSPNIRLEKELRSDRHLLEFSQLDIEIRDISAVVFRSLIENMVIHVFKRVKESCQQELYELDTEVEIPRKPFRVYTSWDLREEYGLDFESRISHHERDLFWITDFKREFYDREEPDRRGHYVNYDLFYPDGFGEALSGGERDFEYEVLVRKILERGQNPDEFKPYLDLAKKGILKPSAGGGLGIERLIRFLTRRSHIRDTTLFPKIPEEPIYL